MITGRIRKRKSMRIFVQSEGEKAEKYTDVLRAFLIKQITQNGQKDAVLKLFIYELIYNQKTKMEKMRCAKLLTIWI